MSLFVVETCTGNPGRNANCVQGTEAILEPYSGKNDAFQASTFTLLATLLGVAAKGTHPRACHILKPDMGVPSFHDTWNPDAQAMDGACSACIEAPPM